MEDAQSLLDILGELLAPLGSERRNKIVAWVEQEIKTHAICQYVYEEGPPIIKDESGHDTGGPQVWRIGQPSPLDSTETVFAMFFWDAAKTVAAYTFQNVDVDGKPATFFYRSLILKPVHVHGPVHHDALMPELALFLADDETDPEPEAAAQHAQANGA